MAPAGVALGLAGLCLAVVCWRRRALLGGVCAAGVIALDALAVVTDRAAYVAAAGIALVIGGVLFALGQVVQRLLDAEPDDEQ